MHFTLLVCLCFICSFPLFIYLGLHLHSVSRPKKCLKNAKKQVNIKNSSTMGGGGRCPLYSLLDEEDN